MSLSLLGSTRCGEKLQAASTLSFPFNPTGAIMKISISYKDVEKHRPAEKEIQRFASKLSRLLKSYNPDLLQLRGAFAQNPRNGEFIFSANLVLPSNTLHATSTATHIGASCKQAFGELVAQVKKHQARLRKDYEWKRKRPRLGEALS
jgi:ribosome-associated translation inhibitor RaiA